MSNVLKQAQQEVARFKTKFIAPEVMEEMKPKLKAEYLKAVEEYRNTPQFKKVVSWHAKHAINGQIRDYFNSEKFQRRVFKLIEKTILVREEFNAD